MASKTHNYSQNDYRRLGERIRKNSNNISQSDLEMLQFYRTTYRSPLSTVFSQVERLAQIVDKNCVCSYRVKRIESIVSKLNRLPGMQLERVGDIAGCRCIMSNNEAAYKLYEAIIQKTEEKKLGFEIKGKVRDYNKKPSENDPGYRSIHLYACIDKRTIEIQIRSFSQHSWATLVEISDVIYKKQIKEKGRTEENKDLFDFHLLLSKPHQELSLKEIKKICDIAMSYKYLERIGSVFAQNYINVRKVWNKKNKKNKSFVLIATDKEGIPEFNLFPTFEEAEKEYFALYNNNPEEKNIVLTHITDKSFSKVSIAYSNYFMTYNSIFFEIHSLMAALTIKKFKSHHIYGFKKYYCEYLRTILVWIQYWKQDVKAFNIENINTGMARTQEKDEWFYNLSSIINLIIEVLFKTNNSLHYSIFRCVSYNIKRRLNAKFNQKMKEEKLDISI